MRFCIHFLLYGADDGVWPCQGWIYWRLTPMGIFDTTTPPSSGTATPPVLDATKTPSLGTINKNATAPVNGSTTGSALVSSLIDSNGTLKNYSDANGDQPGIAITGISSNGTLWYSTTNGANWSPVGSVSDASARVLYANADTRLYFQPNADYPGGIIKDALTFKAWDSTVYSNGQGSVSTVAAAGGSATKISELATGGTAYKVTLDGKYAYIAEDLTGLKIVDISDPFNPVKVGSFDTNGIAYGVAVKGNYAYLADGPEGVLRFDISNRSAPSLQGSYDTGRAEALAIKGDYLYVAGYYKGLEIYDLSKPFGQQYLGGYDPPNGVTYNITLNGDYAYLVGTYGLEIVNISTPGNPRLTGYYYTLGGETGGVAVSGTYAYVTDYQNGLVVFDISNPASPKKIGGYDTIGYAYDVTVVGSYAYLADYYYGMEVFNISNPANPILTTSIDPAGVVSGIALDTSGHAYLAAATDGLVIVNVGGGSSVSFSSASDTVDLTVSATVLPALSLSATATAQAEGNSGSTAYQFTVTRAGDTSGSSSVAWAVSGSSASPADGSDFVGGALPSGTVSFAAGETTKTVTINVQGDTTYEPSEGFTVSLATPSGATLGSVSSVSAGITNDDRNSTGYFYTYAPESQKILNLFAGIFKSGATLSLLDVGTAFLQGGGTEADLYKLLLDAYATEPGFAAYASGSSNSYFADAVRDNLTYNAAVSDSAKTALVSKISAALTTYGSRGAAMVAVMNDINTYAGSDSDWIAIKNVVANRAETAAYYAQLSPGATYKSIGILTAAVADVTDTRAETLTLQGTSGADIINLSAITPPTSTFTFTLDGKGGADTLAGTPANDIIIGGTGGDRISVGSGTDTVKYTANGETAGAITSATANNVKDADIITGMTAGDLIQLYAAAAVTATTTTAGASLLTAVTAGGVALVSGIYNAGSKMFTVGAASETNDDLLVQWADGTSVQSIVLDGDYYTGASTVTLVGTAAMHTLTLTAAP